jgi:hypothetical protein
MNASEYIRKKLGKAIYSDFKRRLENKPQGCIIQCSKVNCKLNYPGYEFRDYVRVGKGMCDCIDNCFLESGQPLGDGIELGDMIGIQNLPPDEYIQDDNGDYIIVDDPEDPYLLRSIILVAADEPLVIRKKSRGSADTIAILSISGYIKELPYKLVKATASSYYIIGHFLDKISVSTNGESILEVETSYVEAQTASVFILKVSTNTFMVESYATYESPASTTEMYGANLMLHYATFANSKLYVILKASNETSAYSFMYRKNNVEGLLDSTQIIAEAEGEHLYLFEHDEDLLEDPFMVSNDVVPNIQTVSTQVEVGPSIYYTQSFDFEQMDNSYNCVVKNNNNSSTITIPRVNYAVIATDNYMYVAEFDKDTYEMIYYRSFRSPNQIYPLAPYIMNDDVIFSGLFSSRIFCEQNNNVALSRYYFSTTGYSAYIYYMNKYETNIVWGVKIDGLVSLNHVITTRASNVLAVGVYSNNGCVVYDEDYYRTNNIVYSQTSTNTSNNIFIAKFDIDGYCIDLIKLSGTGSLYKPLYVIPIGDDDFIIVFKSNGPVTFMRLNDSRPSTIDTYGTEPVYFARYNTSMTCTMYGSITLNSSDEIKEVYVDNELYISGTTSVENPVYKSLNDKSYKIDTPLVNGTRTFKLKIKV